GFGSWRAMVIVTPNAFIVENDELSRRMAAIPKPRIRSVKRRMAILKNKRDICNERKSSGDVVDSSV
ncbi:MAG: hypothetical protein OEY67_10105, partial [Gammaproteobacteria bacterium]|nr:hypothetical protein [Gammaproteobacteria bacterium]